MLLFYFIPSQIYYIKKRQEISWLLFTFVVGWSSSLTAAAPTTQQQTTSSSSSPSLVVVIISQSASQSLTFLLSFTNIHTPKYQVKSVNSTANTKEQRARGRGRTRIINAFTSLSRLLFCVLFLHHLEFNLLNKFFANFVLIIPISMCFCYYCNLFYLLNFYLHLICSLLSYPPRNYSLCMMFVAKFTQQQHY